MEATDKGIIQQAYKNLIESDISFNETLISLLPKLEGMTYDRLSSVCIALNHMGNARSKKESGFEFDLANPRVIWDSITPEKEPESNLTDYKTSYKIKDGKKVTEKSSSSRDFKRGSFRYRDVVDAFRKIAHARLDIGDQISHAFNQSRDAFNNLDKEIHRLVVEENADLGAIKVAMVAAFPEEQKVCEAIVNENVEYYEHINKISSEQAKRIKDIDARRVASLNPECRVVLQNTKLASCVEKIIKSKTRHDALKRLLSKVSDDKMFEFCKNSLRSKK